MSKVLNDELPESWLSCSLGDVVDYGKTEKAEPSEIDSTAWVLELEDIEKDTSRILQRLTFEERQSKSTKNRFQAGDVLYGKLRPYLNKVVLADAPGYCTTEVIPLRATGAIQASYLFHWLKHPLFLEYVTEVSHGLNMPRLGTEAGKAAPLVLAPLAEQKRIADKLDALLGRVDACRARLNRVPDLLKRFRQSVLASATSGKLTEDWRNRTSPSKKEKPNVVVELGDEVPPPFEELPFGWEVERAADAVAHGGDIVYGIVQPGQKLTDGVPYVRGMDIENGKILIHQLLRTSPTIAKRYSRSSLKGGDVLLGIIRATKVALVPDELEGANITQGTARFRPSSRLKSKFLAFALESPALQKWLHAHYRGIDMPGLNLGDVRRLPLPIPPLGEQAEIVRRVDALLALADRIEARLANEQRLLERLTPATLNKAFHGELVPQDPNDEPASVILERLKKEHLQKTQKLLPRKKARPFAMIALSPEVLKKTILTLPNDQFTFAELRDKVHGDYDTLSDLVFALLAEKTPVIKQVFDKKSKAMQFQRLKP